MSQHVPSDQDCRITYRLSSLFKEEIFSSERSVGSGSLNMSGLSIPTDARYYEKRCTPALTQTRCCSPRTTRTHTQ
jgi:hypothetical protein